MHTRTLIGIAVTTLVLSLVVVGGLWQVDRATPARASGPAPGMQRSAVASSASSLPERPIVPEPDDPAGADVTVPAEPLTIPMLEPRRAPALDPVPALAGDRVTVAALVLPAPPHVPEPEDPVFADGTDLAERIVVPGLTRPLWFHEACDGGMS